MIFNLRKKAPQKKCPIDDRREKSTRQVLIPSTRLAVDIQAYKYTIFLGPVTTKSVEPIFIGTIPILSAIDSAIHYEQQQIADF